MGEPSLESEEEELGAVGRSVVYEVKRELVGLET